MELRFWKHRPAEERADATNTAIAALLGNARAGVDSDGTAAAVATIGLIGRLFAAATIDPPEWASALTPAVLQDIARRLIMHGNAVYTFELSPPIFGVGWQ